MSDDHSPPDLTETADFPLDEFSPEPKDSVLDHPSVDYPMTLFNDAQPLGLSQTRPAAGQGPAANILEGAERPVTNRLNPTRFLERFRTFLATSRDHAQPLYRRQGTLAVAGLCLLSVVVAVSFPRTRATLGSGLEVVTNNAPDPAAPAGSLSGNRNNSIDPAGSDGLFTGSGADEAVNRSQQPKRTASTTRRASSTGGASAAGPSEQLPTFAELTETSATVGPGPTTCRQGAAVTPDCQSSTTAAPGTTATPSTTSSGTATTAVTEPTPGEDSSTTGPTAGASSSSTSTLTSTSRPATTATTAPTTTATTAKPTTTKKPTTTAKPITTEKPTTTAKPTTTKKPTTTAKPTTTKKPTTTIATTTTTPTSTTRPSTTATTAGTTSTTGGPGEGSSTPTFIQCTPGGGSPPCP